MAAVAAARQNISTTLVNPSARIGGMMSGGLCHTDVGDRTAIGGLANDFFMRVSSHYGNSNSTLPQYEFEPHVAELIFKDMMQDSGVNVIDAIGIVSVEKSKSTLLSFSTPSYTFTGKVFVDGTYEGSAQLSLAS